MFIGPESPERQEYSRPSILQFAFISFHMSSQLSSLLSDCHMLFLQDGITMISSMFPPGFTFYQFLTVTNSAVVSTVAQIYRNFPLIDAQNWVKGYEHL